MCSVLTNSPLSLSSPASLPLYITCHYWAFPTQPFLLRKTGKTENISDKFFRPQTSQHTRPKHHLWPRRSGLPDIWFCPVGNCGQFSIFLVSILCQRSQCNDTANAFSALSSTSSSWSTQVRRMSNDDHTNINHLGFYPLGGGSWRDLWYSKIVIIW